MRYTRAGRFTVDAEGMLSDPAGYKVEGGGGPIQIPANAGQIEISEKGAIRVDGQQIGTIRLVRFENPMNLERLDNAHFSAAGMEALDVDEPSIRQGFLESSNVNPLTEMSEMITHFRMFESQQKVLQTNDQILGHVTRELGKF